MITDDRLASHGIITTAVGPFLPFGLGAGSPPQQNKTAVRARRSIVPTAAGSSADKAADF